mmetsp:Transcript_389/g.1133  ORF Transcript_389/g.1133 Transcript_389/m.1133 type:complete len:534 (-) Transcript_389:28-1629(-)
MFGVAFERLLEELPRTFDRSVHHLEGTQCVIRHRIQLVYFRGSKIQLPSLFWIAGTELQGTPCVPAPRMIRVGAHCALEDLAPSGDVAAGAALHQRPGCEQSGVGGALFVALLEQLDGFRKPSLAGFEKAPGLIVAGGVGVGFDAALEGCAGFFQETLALFQHAERLPEGAVGGAELNALFVDLSGETGVAHGHFRQLSPREKQEWRLNICRDRSPSSPSQQRRRLAEIPRVLFQQRIRKPNRHVARIQLCRPLKTIPRAILVPRLALRQPPPMIKLRPRPLRHPRLHSPLVHRPRGLCVLPPPVHLRELPPQIRVRRGLRQGLLEHFRAAREAAGAEGELGGVTEGGGADAEDVLGLARGEGEVRGGAHGRGLDEELLGADGVAGGELAVRPAVPEAGVAGLEGDGLFVGLAGLFRVSRLAFEFAYGTPNGCIIWRELGGPAINRARHLVVAQVRLMQTPRLHRLWPEPLLRLDRRRSLKHLPRHLMVPFPRLQHRQRPQHHHIFPHVLQAPLQHPPRPPRAPPCLLHLRPP